MPSLRCDVSWLYLIWQTPSSALLLPSPASVQPASGQISGIQPLSGSTVVGLPEKKSILWSLPFAARQKAGCLFIPWRLLVSCC